MKTSLAILVAALAVSSAGRAQEANLRQEVVRANIKWLKALAGGDLEGLERAEADDFVLIQDGTVTQKADHLAGLREQRRVSGPSYSLQLVELQVFPSDVTPVWQRQIPQTRPPSRDIALLTGFLVTQPAPPGSTGRMAVSEVWVKENGRWRVATAHYSAVR